MTESFEAESICFTQADTVILKNICFNFKFGQIVCLLGNNGAGKSTLLKIGAGIQKPTNGRILFNNVDIFSLNEKEKACILGWLPQNIVRPYNLNLYDFMQLIPNQNHFNKIEKSMDMFDISQFKSKNISLLSGGEWKRAQIARLWINQQKVLLLDEPDSDLDLKHKKNLIQQCKNYAIENNAILFIVTHDIVFASEVADQICALTDGLLVWNSNSQEFWKTQVINKIFSTKVINYYEL